jgi:hypothetical protein
MTLIRKTIKNLPRALGFLCAGVLSVCLVFCVHRLHSAIVHKQRTSAQVSEKAASEVSPASLPPSPSLHIDSVVQHGHIVELRGSTEPGAVVMINGQTAVIFDGSTFRHFLGPLPSGTTIVTVTAQDEHGGVNTQQVALTID